MRIDLCNITKITGYIVDNARDCRLEFTKTFSNIPETERFKYLDIFEKVLSGKPGKICSSWIFWTEKEPDI